MPAGGVEEPGLRGEATRGRQRGLSVGARRGRVYLKSMGNVFWLGVVAVSITLALGVIVWWAFAPEQAERLDADSRIPLDEDPPR
jgi:cbb3-type cytochrome oxidase subunit 3